jgi:hypothetical protein
LKVNKWFFFSPVSNDQISYNEIDGPPEIYWDFRDFKAMLFGSIEPFKDHSDRNKHQPGDQPSTAITTY